MRIIKQNILQIKPSYKLSKVENSEVIIEKMGHMMVWWSPKVHIYNCSFNKGQKPTRRMFMHGYLWKQWANEKTQTNLLFAWSQGQVSAKKLCT